MNSTYPGALSVAAQVASHLERQTAAARAAGHSDVARPAGTRSVETLVNAAFWASFRREEGRAPRISLAFLPPEDAADAMTVARRLSLRPDSLAHLSPAVERPGIHLGVWCDEDGYYVWGATRRIPPFCLVVEVIQPGLLVIKHPRLGGGVKFANVAVLEGDSVKVVDDAWAASDSCPGFVRSLFGSISPNRLNGPSEVLVQLCLAMYSHGHGGILLVVPDGTTKWRESIIWPVRFLLEPPFGFEEDLADIDDDDVRSLVEVVGGATAIDGATIITRSTRMIAFGSKIGRKHGAEPIERLRLTEPILGQQPVTLHPTDIGGTRHLSAAQFIQDQHDALALVASQDGQFTVFSWSGTEGIVQAIRIEALLL